MKKLMVCILAVGMVAGVVSAEQVLSKNAVGYVKIPDVQGGVGAANFYLLAHPFESFDGPDHVLTNVFADVPNSTIVSVWDADEQEYINYTRGARGDWLDDAVTATIGRGVGAWVQIPADAAGIDLILMGEVPDEDVTPMTWAEGFTLVGYSFPATIELTNTTMAVALPNNTVLSFWDGDNQEYINYTKGARGDWLDEALDAVLQPGHGFWIQSSEAGDAWNEVKPYTWP